MPRAAWVKRRRQRAEDWCHALHGPLKGGGLVHQWCVNELRTGNWPVDADVDIDLFGNSDTLPSEKLQEVAEMLKAAALTEAVVPSADTPLRRPIRERALR